MERAESLLIIRPQSHFSSVSSVPPHRTASQGSIPSHPSSAHPEVFGEMIHLNNSRSHSSSAQPTPFSEMMHPKCSHSYRATTTYRSTVLETVASATTAQLQSLSAGRVTGGTNMATAVWFPLPRPRRQSASPTSSPVQLVCSNTNCSAR